MDGICRLCCSSNFVNNYIFDDENALYLKMSLYLPIKVFRNDRLPQKICDKCSCKVNDFYQFCNEAIEVQRRLQSSLQHLNSPIDHLIDLTIKQERPPSPPHALIVYQNQETQTDLEAITENFSNDTEVKEELKTSPLLAIKKEEETILSDDMNNDVISFDDFLSDNSDISLNTLKKKKRKHRRLKAKEIENGETKEKDHKKEKRRKRKLKDLEDLVKCALPEGTTITSVIDKGDAITLDDSAEVKIEIVKTEAIDESILEELGCSLKESVDEEADFRCCICFIKLRFRSEMLHHYKSHLDKTENVDKIGNWTPDSPVPTESGYFKCTYCVKVFTDRGGWQRHVWRHKHRAYRCTICEKSFGSPAQILKHGQTHTVSDEMQPLSKRFVCDMCPEEFVYMKCLMEHRSNCHPEASGRKLVNRCVHCGREFAHLNSLRRHLRSHSGERNHLCNVCGKALSSSEHLKFHIRIHTGYKPNVCKTCGKGFVKKCNLTLHERVHSGEKPHVCSHCGKAFSQRSTLVIHERYHSGARPYVCSLCGRGFVAKGLLSMHLKTTCI